MNKMPERYTIRYDPYGYADGIELEGMTVMHLIAGSMANEQHAGEIVETLNRLRPGSVVVPVEVLRRAVEALEEIPTDANCLNCPVVQDGALAYAALRPYLTATADGEVQP